MNNKLDKPSKSLLTNLEIDQNINLDFVTFLTYVTFVTLMMCFELCDSYDVQCSPLNRLTLGHHKSDNNNRMIQLTDVYCVLLRYRWASNL